MSDQIFKLLYHQLVRTQVSFHFHLFILLFNVLFFRLWLFFNTFLSFSFLVISFLRLSHHITFYETYLKNDFLMIFLFTYSMKHMNIPTQIQKANKWHTHWTSASTQHWLEVPNVLSSLSRGGHLFGTAISFRTSSSIVTYKNVAQQRHMESVLTLNWRSNYFTSVIMMSAQHTKQWDCTRQPFHYKQKIY